MRKPSLTERASGARHAQEKWCRGRFPQSSQVLQKDFLQKKTPHKSRSDSSTSSNDSEEPSHIIPRISVAVYKKIPGSAFTTIFFDVWPKNAFSRGPTRNGVFFPKRQKVWLWCWLQPPGSLIPCLHLPSRLLSSSAPKKFLQYLAFFCVLPWCEINIIFWCYCKLKTLINFHQKKCPVKRRNFPAKRRKNPTKRRNFFRGDFEGFQNN